MKGYFSVAAVCSTCAFALVVAVPSARNPWVGAMLAAGEAFVAGMYFALGWVERRGVA